MAAAAARLPGGNGSELLGLTGLRDLLAAACTAQPARGVPETGQWSCCAFVFVDQATDDIAAVDLFGSWRSRHALAL
jgi:hypothetical protein